MLSPRTGRIVAGAGVTAENPISLGRAWDLCDRLISAVALASADVQTLEPAGDLRRSEPLLDSIVLVGRAADPSTAIRDIASVFSDADILERTPSTLVAAYHDTIVDLRVATPDEFGTVLFLATGGEPHVAQVAALGLSDQRFETEQRLYESVGLPTIPPELRHGSGEIDAAKAGTLPRLIELAQMRGDLHMHSSYSDGRDPVSTMVEACHALGYDYIAITDHSSGAAAARTLAVDAIPRQRGEIDELRARFPRMAILHGVEVDILPDGQLDFADEVLEPFDIVLASLHNHARQDAARLTARTLQALRHPLVNVLCHPANRLVGRSAGYPLDFDAIYAAAAETGTALEVDGAPSHIDLDGEHARAAIAAGVTLTIDSDCHRFEALGRQMRFGIGTARRGWVESRHVLNTRPLTDVLAFVAAKRASKAGPGR
jgi:DNA polymerase (family 10)